MAYMPAEDDDEYDSDDGFLHNDFSARKAPYMGSQSQGQTIKRFGEKHVSWTLSDPDIGDGGQTEGTSFPVKRFQDANLLTMEDLKMAVMRGNLELSKRCLDQGLAVDEPLRGGWNVLMYAGNYARPDVVRLLLEHGANAKYHCDMYTPLMSACSASTENEDNVQKCVRILVEAGADVNAKDRLHTTPLMLASREGHLLAVKELLQHGADVNKQDSHGWTALTWAAQRSYKAVVVELLDSGADPNIQHADKLTVKDLAAHLPSDEVLALLERRPPNVVSSQGDSHQTSSKTAEPSSSSHCTLDSRDSIAKLTDLRYGELEVFLIGLDLPHLVPVFEQQLIDLNLLLTLTEQDLILAGVDQVGARKKVLDAVQAVHRKDWQPSSLVSIHYNKKISCADAVAMLANSSKHLRYIGSTVIYVKEQLKKHPETIIQSTDKVSPIQFVRHTEDAMKNVMALRDQVQALQSELAKEMKKRSLDPPDLIEYNCNKKRTHLWAVLGGVFVLTSSFVIMVWYRKDKVLDFLHSKILSLFA